jgi:hypothetical protein
LKTITDDLESLDDESDCEPESVSSRSFSLPEDRDHRRLTDTDRQKQDLIEQLGREVSGKAAPPITANVSQTEVTASDSGFGDSTANLKKRSEPVKSDSNEKVIADPFDLKQKSADLGKPSNDSNGANLDPMAVGSTREFSFNRTEAPEAKGNESGAHPAPSTQTRMTDEVLRQVSPKSKVIRKPSATGSRVGSARKRMRSAGVQTTASLRRNARTAKESTFSSNYHEVASKTPMNADDDSDAESAEVIEEKNFFYDPASESQERKYFVYLVSDTSSPYYRKDCIGKIVLPVRTQLTLSELRDELFKQGEDSVRSILKKSKNFRFLTETYR